MRSPRRGSATATRPSPSLTPAEDDRFDAMIRALEKNDVKELAEKTGQQVIAMSRTSPGTAQKDASLTESMQKMAGTAA